MQWPTLNCYRIAGGNPRVPEPLTIVQTGSPRAYASADDYNTIAMLARKNGESLNTLLKRVGSANGLYYEDGQTINEVNSL